MAYCPYCMNEASGSSCKHCGKPLHWEPGINQLPAGTMLDGSGLHRYLTGAAIGQGGFGITYIAVEPDSGRRVAVKECFPIQCATRGANGIMVEPKPGQGPQLQGALNSFLDEARLLAKQTELESVVQVLDFFSTNGTAYLVMEYLDGVTLQEKMKNEGRLPSQKLLEMFHPLMRDIGLLHSSGIIHRDISPDNIMWMPNNSLKLLDFGCARSLEDGKSMSVLLKHGFAPVEQYQTRGQGAWTDIYSLCATLYYCITGKLPTPAVERLEGGALMPPNELGAQLSEKQQEALLWGLEVQPANRPQTMELLMGQMYSDRKPSRPKKKREPNPGGRDSNQRTRIIGAAAAALVVIIAVIAIAASGGSGNDGRVSLSSAPAVTGTGQQLLPDTPSAEPSPSAEPTEDPSTKVTEDGLKYVDCGSYAKVVGFDGALSVALTLPEEIDGLPVTEIGAGAFEGQERLQYFIASSDLKRIGEAAFKDCDCLEVLYLARSAEVGDGAFSGCTRLRAIMDLGVTELKPSDFGLGSDVMVYEYGMDTGRGELNMLVTDNAGVIYGLTEEDYAVVLDVPAGLDEVTLLDDAYETPVVWAHEDALDNAESDIAIHMPSEMSFPYELFRRAQWDLKSGSSPSCYGICWLMTCVFTETINLDREDSLAPEELAYISPDGKLVEAAQQLAAELAENFGHERPNGTKWSTLLDEIGVDYSYAMETIEDFEVSEDINAFLADLADYYHGYNETKNALFDHIALGFYWTGNENDLVYMCCLGIIE